MINPKKYDVIAVWYITSHCNFNCKYCFKNLEEKENQKYLSSNKISKAIDFFNKSGLKFLIHMTGGEPFLHPKFVEICKSLTKKHYIGISTNLSSNSIKDFTKKIDPKRVEFIHCSLHISERDRLNLKEDFIKKFKILEQAGFNVFASQVMHPENLNEFDKTFEYFKAEKINIIPKVFREAYRGRDYPEAYTKKEKEKLLMFRRKSWALGTENKELVSQYYKELINGQLSFKNLPCSAGRKLIKIEEDGTVKRCLDENIYMGNIFNGKLKLFNADKICTSEICHCPYFGMAFAFGSPKLVNEKQFKKILKRFVYPHTTPLLKPIRENLRKIFQNSY